MVQVEVGLMKFNSHCHWKCDSCRYQSV